MNEQLVGQPETDSISFEFETKPADLLLAANVVDYKNRANGRQNFQYLGIMLILWMFVPELFKNPAQFLNWVMVIAAVGLGVLVWKMPAYNNKKFANGKAAAQPHVQSTIDHEKIVMQSDAGKGEYRFDDALAIFDYKNVLVLSASKNRVGVIPKDQLDEATLEAALTLIKQGLDDRYEVVEQLSRKKSVGR